MAVNEVRQVREKIDTLQEAMAILAKMIAMRQTNTPEKRSRKASRRQVVEDSSEEESSSSEEEEEEPTPPPKPRKPKKKKKQSQQKATGRSSTFKIDGTYKPGMKWDNSWSKGMKAAYQSARQDFLKTGTKEALKDKIDGIEKMLKGAEATNASQERMDNLTTA